jgi:hypothetical protein
MKKFTKKPTKKQAKALRWRLLMWTAILGFLIAAHKFLQDVIPTLGGLFGF